MCLFQGEEFSALMFLTWPKQPASEHARGCCQSIALFPLLPTSHKRHAVLFRVLCLSLILKFYVKEWQNTTAHFPMALPTLFINMPVSKRKTYIPKIGHD